VKRGTQSNNRRTAQRLLGWKLHAFEDGAIHAPHLASRGRETARQNHVGDTQFTQCGDGIRSY